MEKRGSEAAEEEEEVLEEYYYLPAEVWSVILGFTSSRESLSKFVEKNLVCRTWYDIVPRWITRVKHTDWERETRSKVWRQLLKFPNLNRLTISPYGKKKVEEYFPQLPCTNIVSLKLTSVSHDGARGDGTGPCVPMCLSRFTNLTSMNLDGWCMDSAIEFFPVYSNLTSLRIWGSSCTVFAGIPEAVFGWTNLRKLLWSNGNADGYLQPVSISPKLTDLSLSGIRNHLFDNIEGLIHLKKLTLTCCYIKVVPPEIKCLTNLKELRLNQNNLTALPSEMGLLPSLRHLDLESNRLTEVPMFLSLLTDLSSLKLHYNNIKQISVSQVEFLTKIRGLGIEKDLLQTNASYREYQKARLLGLKKNSKNILYP